MKLKSLMIAGQPYDGESIPRPCTHRPSHYLRLTKTMPLKIMFTKIDDYICYLTTSGYSWPSDTMKSLDFFKPRETHTKAQSSYFIFIFFNFLWRKSVEKSPVKTYMVKWAFWKISKKKLNHHISKRGKKNRFWNRWDLWRIWADSKLSSFETRLWKAC